MKNKFLTWSGSVSIFMLLLFLGFLGRAEAQTFTYIDSSNQVNFRFANYELGVCAPVDTIAEGVNLKDFTDITYHPTLPRLYYFSVSHSTWLWPDPTIFSMDLPTAPTSSIVNPGAPDTTVMGICAYFDNKIYMAGEGLSTFLPFMNPFPNGIYEYLGDLPAGMQCGGGITFRHDTLYLSTANNTLVRVNLEDFSQSEEVFTFPPGTLPIHGLSTLFYNCDSLVTFAMGTDFINKINAIYRVDFDNQTLVEICNSNIPMKGGIASPLSVTLPPCNLAVNLDWDNSSGSTGFDFLADTFCLGSSPITDPDLLVFSEMNRIDSIKIRLLDVLNPGNELLSVGAIPASIQITNQNIVQLTLRNLGGATAADFQEAIHNITYQHLGASPTNGVRRVRFRMYSWFYESEYSYAYLPLYNTILHTSATITPVSCQGGSDGIITLNPPTGGTPPYSLLWDDGTTDTFLENLPAGAYTLQVIDNTGCTRLIDFDLDQPDSLTLALVNAGPMWVCDTVGILNAMAQGGNGGYQYIWDFGLSGSIQSGLPPGNYSVTVTDSKNCTATSSTILNEISFETILVDTICQGVMYPFQNQVFQADTFWCDYLKTSGGCDSLICLNLTVRDTFKTVENAQICLGESYSFHGQAFETDTFFCLPLISQYGCDSLVCLSLNTFFMANEWSIDGALCNGQIATVTPSPGFMQYLWSTGSSQSSLEVASPGWYFLTLTDNLGCTVIDSILIEDNSFEVAPYSLPSSCFGVDDGFIQANSLSGGRPPFQFSLNGGPFDFLGLYESLAPGYYTVEIIDANGCYSMLDFLLPQPPHTWVSLGADQSVVFGEQITIVVSASDPFANLYWRPPAPCSNCWDVVYQPLHSETLVVELLTNSGCLALDSVRINVASPSLFVYLPNIFSPNGDGINDYWEAYKSNAVGRFLSLKVFSRWGELLYVDLTPDANVRWDGTSNGKPAPQGVYICFVEYELINGERRIDSVNATLIR
jgi:gliding motility-associated-like protein